MKDLFGDRRCSEAVIQFLCSTEVGRRFRERGLEEDDPGGERIPKLGQSDIECCLEQQDDGCLEIMYVFRLCCLFVLGFCFLLFLYFFVML
jgi:hypothetical protein